MNSDRNNGTVKRTSGKHMGKVAPSTKAHEVVRKGGRYDHVVFVGSRTACNRYWVALSSEEARTHEVRVCADWRKW